MATTFGLSLISMVQEFCRRTAVPVPTVAATATDAATLQQVSLLNEAIEEINLQENWTDLIQQLTFLTVGQSDQGDIDTLAGFPVEFILNDIMWNQTTRLPIFGPVDPQRWEQYKALPITGTLLQYRLQNKHVMFYPLTPPVGHTILFEAQMRYAIVDNTGPSPVYKQFFTKDTDQCAFPDDMMMAALRWKWKREKGLAYAEDKSRYYDILSTRRLRNGTGRILNMNGDEENFGPGILVPSGSWNIHGGGLPGGAWDSTLGP